MYKQMQLVCVLLTLSLVNLVHGQATATASENGIVSAAGAPQPTQSVSYSIMGGGILAPTATSQSSASLMATPSSKATDTSILNGTEEDISNTKDHGLTTPAVVGIVVAVIAAVVGILLFAVYMHRRKKQDLSRAKRKSIMDAEFASLKSQSQHFTTPMTTVDKSQIHNLGYFDLAKPLPMVIEEHEERASYENLSRSSTIIADAADVARMNRKASVPLTHQNPREQQRERNQALHILVTNEDNRTTSLPDSPLASFPVTPREAHYSMTRGACYDGDGDPFARRPSKI